MSDQLVSFKWWVPKAGFRQIDAKPFGSETSDLGPLASQLPDTMPGNIFRLNVLDAAKNGGRFLVFAEEPADAISDRTYYCPLQKYPTLFRIFADLALSPNNILQFANKFGNLGGDHMVAITQGSYADGNIQLPLTGELFTSWAYEIHMIKKSVGIWELLKAHDELKLSSHFKKSDGGEWHFFDPTQEQAQTDTKNNKGEGLLSLVRPSNFDGSENVFDAAKIFLATWVDNQLQNRLSAGIDVVNDTSEFRLSLRPTSLIGAIWLQFAQAIVGNKGYGTCIVCNSWMELTSSNPHTPRIYCSDACRMRAYRKRKSTRLS